MNTYMMMRNFYILLRRDLKILLPTYKDSVINALVWVGITVGVKVYILPYFGVAASYGSLILATSVIAIANFEAVNQAMLLAYDLHGPRVISYDLTIPLPPYLVFIERGFCFALYAMMVSGLILPLGKLLFWNHVDLTQMFLPYYVLIFVASNIIMGMFSVWLISYISHVHKMGAVWTRIVFPLWYLGGFEFSWIAVYKTLGSWAYLLLLNPCLYAMEEAKSSLFGPEEYIPFWVCIGVLITFSILLALIGIKVLKRRLDLV